MHVSYQWLKDYFEGLPSLDKLSEILTNTGLEVGNVEVFESIRGGLRGLVIGEVLTREKHPDADRLSLTTVNVGNEILPIVCGAPNVDAGQKVVVATVGTTLYSGADSFKIKKSKIRGCESCGMICAEDEIGLGKSHDGIMVLPADAPVGMPAAEYFGVSEDHVLEVDLTPNRIDGASHLGVVRDVVAYLRSQGQDAVLTRPSVEDFAVDCQDYCVDVQVQDSEACLRYAGVSISDVVVKESPDWLKKRLQAIGLNPINNVVDVTNYVLHETGQPLHAFDGDRVGNEIVVKTMPTGTAFVTLDGVERKLGETDLMICNTAAPMCMAGVMGGLDSGVSDTTTKLFLEGACFNPVRVRKTAKAHGLNTDSSFRFERGVDPNETLYAIKRAALLIKEVAGGRISSDVIDIYPNPVQAAEVEVKWKHVDRLIGQVIDRDTLRNIMESLDMKIVKEQEEGVRVAVPTYRVDVLREADVIEEILRIYGYNKIEVGQAVKSTLVFTEKPDEHEVRNIISNQLSAHGFFEMMCNSLNKKSDYEGLTTLPEEHLVKILNPLSQELNIMRQSLLFGGLECIAYNQNRKRPDVRMYEFGQCYFYHKGEEGLKAYRERPFLGLFTTGRKHSPSWIHRGEQADFFELKAHVDNILSRLGVDCLGFSSEYFSNELYAEALCYSKDNKRLFTMGYVHEDLLERFGIKGAVAYAEIHWDVLLTMAADTKVNFVPIPKYPEVKRDLSMLIDESIEFEKLKEAAYKAERKLLKGVELFDVYEGEKLPKGKKSYALTFILQDEGKTLTDKQIDKVMKRLIMVYTTDFGAEIRGI